MRYAKFTAIIIACSCSAGSFAADPPPNALDLDDALARQSAEDLISGVALAYDCAITQKGMRRLGSDDEAVYLIQVMLEGSECDNALLLLNRHGEMNDFVFRAWEVPEEIEQIDIARPPPALPGPDG